VLSRRPGGVTFAGWLIAINGVLLSIGAIVILLAASNTRLMVRHGMAQGALLIVGFVVLIVGLGELLLVYALFGGSNVARIVVTVLFGISLLSSLGVVLARGDGALAAWITGIIDVIVLVGLWGTPGAQEFFRAPSMAARSTPPPVPPRPV
jgi:hypothetical protein